MVSGDVLKLWLSEFLPAVLLRQLKRSIRLPKELSLAGLRPETFIPASARLQFSVIFRDAKPNALCLSA